MNEWIYDNTPDNSARFTLGIRGKSPMFCFGINPSTAAPGALDNTLKSVDRIAQRHGHDGWVMFNVYPQRSTDPNGMHDELDQELHQENLQFIEKIIMEYPGPVPVLAAWGTLITKRPYLRDCLRDIHNLFQKHGHEWVCIGKRSIAGHPHHPLYLSNAEMVKPFPMDEYIESLK